MKVKIAPTVERAVAAALVLMALAATALVAQTPTDGEPRTLTLDEALELARRNNPGFLSASNDQVTADWQVREAYGNFLPSVNTSAGLSYTDAGVQRFGTFTGGDIGAGTTDYYISDYSLSLNYQLNGSTIFGARSARADRNAVEARVNAQRFNLESAVALQYMAALRAREGLRVAERQLDRSRENFEIASTRYEAGAAPATESKNAEVERGRAEAAVLRSEATLRAEKLRLMEQLGVELGGEVVLASEFDVFQPTWTRDQLVSLALGGHPQLRALEAQEDARVADVRQASSAYFPSLSAVAQWSGFTRQIGNRAYLLNQAEKSLNSDRENCIFFNGIHQQVPGALPDYQPEDCSGYVMTDADRQDLLSSNDVFPFDFTKQPLSLSFRVSLPVFQGFSRQRQLEQAQAAADDARHALRAEELRLRTAVTNAYDQVMTSYQLVQIEERNVQVASEQLELARQRYQLGAANFLELLDAESSMQTAERDYLNAVFDFHQNLVALEAATGVRLRSQVD